MKSKTVRFQDDMGTNGSNVLACVLLLLFFFFVLKMAVVL